MFFELALDFVVRHKRTVARMSHHDHVPVVQDLLPRLEEPGKDVKLEPRHVPVLQDVDRRAQRILPQWVGNMVVVVVVVVVVLLLLLALYYGECRLTTLTTLTIILTLLMLCISRPNQTKPNLTKPNQKRRHENNDLVIYDGAETLWKLEAIPHDVKMIPHDVKMISHDV
jgi:hypothetical protein